MLKNMIKKAVLLLTVFAMLLPLVSCTTDSGNGYKKKKPLDSIDSATEAINGAEKITDTFTDISYAYEFFINLDTPNGESFRLGTENTFSFTGRGSDSPAGYRKNIYTSVQGDTTNVITKDEEFFLSGGNIYTERFGKRYRSQMNVAEFLDYTEYSQMSVNTEYLSERNFAKATLYELFKDRKEYVFTEAGDYIKEGIIAFTGLNETDYTYEVENVKLSVLIEKDGSLSEKHLTFTVDYYSAAAPNSVLTYEGDFAYRVISTKDISVPERDKSKVYTEMPHLSLLSSITSKGYAVLMSQGAIDAQYKKYVKVSDQNTKEYVFDAFAHITAKQVDGKMHYGSIDTEYFSKETKKHNTTGIFQDAGSYKYRYYDHVADEDGGSIDQSEPKYTSEQFLNTIAATLTTEQLFEEEISSVSIKSETDTSVTFSVKFNNYSAKLYAAYLVDTFSESSNTADLNGQALSLKKCDIEITVRKSDGCLLSQSIEFEAEITGTGNMSGYINVEGSFLLDVASTDEVQLLTLNDYNAKIESVRNPQ